MAIASDRFIIKGLVQGVGFRPFVYKLALRCGLVGYVRNSSSGVEIAVEGNLQDLARFESQLLTEAPPVSQINSVDKERVAVENYTAFEIINSFQEGGKITRVSPDIAVCPECLADIKAQEHRLNYPFVNCTNCGPRFSIIRGIPYDRPYTTMDVFKMCEQCANEYMNPLDRRFHAQPIACNNCGPIYELITGNNHLTSFSEIMNAVVELITAGKIVAIKGIGGFHLVGDALSEGAAHKIRTYKNRENKPFAVMFRSIDDVRTYAFVNESEGKSLQSWRRPVVLLKSLRPLTPLISRNFQTVGAILPYMPLHYLLFEKLKTPALIFTSANITDEPVIIDNDIAQEQMESGVDGLLVYNRQIYNRIDDSVVQVVNNKERVIRRARGYAPIPIQTDFNIDGIWAVGAELINAFCIGKGREAIISQYLGDLKNFETYSFFLESLERFKMLFSFTPKLVAHDLHPDYLSTQYAMSLGLRTIAVQHHHAHIASCMAEHNISGKVIGVCFDGTGYGTDGTIWGSEFFLADLIDFERLSHFEYLPLPGGELAIKEPWRCAVALLYQYFGKSVFERKWSFLRAIKESDLTLVLKAIDKKINTPLSCGAGRYFDALSAMLNICLVSTFEGEAAILLENTAASGISESYSSNDSETISFKSVFEQILRDIDNNIDTAVISAKFHNTIVGIVCKRVENLSSKNDIDTIILSGGVFQNRYLLGGLENELQKMRFKVFAHEQVPTNDGGIALGQIVIAGNKLCV